MEEQDNENIKRNVQENFEPVLVNVEKNDPDGWIHIDKDEFKIGRGKTNDEIIMNVSISRQHCIFKRTGFKEWTIEDTSSNGTYVNGTLLSQGDVQPINIGDLVQFGPMSEFTYKFEINDKIKEEPLAKKRRISTTKSTPEIDLNHIVMRQKTFEESQQLERDNLAERMKAKHNEQLELRNELDKLLNDRETALGEKDHLNKQINSLEKNIEDVKLAEMNLEKLNRELSERLDKERHEFEVKLNEEKQKMEKALEISRKEREVLENNMKEQLEKLRNEQEIECKKLTESLTEEKKTAEKLQSEKVEFAQKLKTMEDALVKIEAKANELQTTLEKQNAAKAPTVVPLGNVAENIEIVDDSNLKILDTIDLTIEGVPAKNSAETSDADSSSNKNVFNKVGDIMDEQLTCSICSELFVTAVTLNCTHTFCQYCINTWIKKKRECPVCRRGITAMNRSLVLDNFIDKMVENLSSDYKKRRTEIVKERRESERLAAEAVNRETGKRGRGRGRGRGTNLPANAIVNLNPNRTRGAATAATSGTIGTNQSPSRTDGGNTNRNNASGSGSQLSQQSASTGGASVYEQATTTQGTSDTSQRTNDFDDSDGSDWSTSDGSSTDGDGDGDADRDGDGDGDSITPSYSVSQTSEDPETQFGDMDSIFGDSDDNSFEQFGDTIDYNDDPWNEEPDEDYEEGLPGAPYGGYGVCYYCGHRGHWAPGCPNR